MQTNSEHRHFHKFHDTELWEGLTLGENGSVDSTDTILTEKLVNSKLQNLTIS